MAWNSEYQDAQVVTPSDTASNCFRALLAQDVGTITVVTEMGTTVQFTVTDIGQLIPVHVTQVKATGTSCTNIVGLL